MRWLLAGVCAGVLMVLSTAGCGSDEDAAGKEVDAASMCCPIETARCGCFRYGGTRAGDGSCSYVCDAEPDGWEWDIDENGCPVLRWVGGTGSCVKSIDAAPPDAVPADAGLSDANPSDAAP